MFDVTENKLHGFASDAFSVACVALRVFRLAGNSKLKGDVMEDLGKAPLLEEIDVSRTRLFGNIEDIGVKAKKPSDDSAALPAADVEGGNGANATLAAETDGDGGATATDANNPSAASEKPEETTGCPLLRILNVSQTEILGNMEHLKGAPLLEQVLCQPARSFGDS